MLGYDASNFSRGSVSVVGLYFGQQSHAMGTEDFVNKVFEITSAIRAQSLFDGSLDVFSRHVRGATFQKHHSQSRVHAAVTAAMSCGHSNLFR
jgi:hypothetical protein